jgi:hypothetical protein
LLQQNIHLLSGHWGLLSAFVNVSTGCLPLQTHLSLTAGNFLMVRTPQRLVREFSAYLVEVIIQVTLHSRKLRLIYFLSKQFFTPVNVLLHLDILSINKEEATLMF